MGVSSIGCEPWRWGGAKHKGNGVKEEAFFAERAEGAAKRRKEGERRGREKFGASKVRAGIKGNKWDLKKEPHAAIQTSIIEIGGGDDGVMRTMGTLQKIGIEITKPEIADKRAVGLRALLGGGGEKTSYVRRIG